MSQGDGQAPAGIPAVDSGSDATELLDKARGSTKKSVALVQTNARLFLEAIREGTLERLTKDHLYHQQAEVVFAYWAAKLNHPSALYDMKRERRIVARLRESAGDLSILCYAVDGALRDDWIMGREERSMRPYDGVETIFRDRAQVERLAESCPKFRQGRKHPLIEKYAPNGNGHAV